jgi:hypothetical protein
MMPRPESYATTMLETETPSCGGRPDQADFKSFLPAEGTKTPTSTSTGSIAAVGTFVSVRAVGVDSISVSYDVKFKARRLMHLRANGALRLSEPSISAGLCWGRLRLIVQTGSSARESRHQTRPVGHSRPLLQAL